MYAYIGLIFLLSSLSNPYGELGLPFILPDYMAHSIAYFLLALLAFPAFKALKWTVLSRNEVVAGACFSLLFGITDEIHQWFVPARTMSFFDLACDAIGILAACALYLSAKKILTSLHVLHLSVNDL